MKWFFLLAALISLQASAQTTGLLENQKDAWGVSYTYIGELKDGKPNGMGIAKYSSGTALRYVGGFSNGVFSGKGTVLFEDGSFQTGQWANGKLNGKGSFLNSNGVLYVGQMKDGLKHGQGILVWKDNAIVRGNFANDKMEGRCVYIWKEGKNISDINYVNDKRNGTGYQYESASKKLYEGEWKDDKWVQSTSASFASFLTKSDFVSESTENHILMGPVTSTGILKDTSYYYDLKKNKRYFGYYERGFLVDGVIVTDSSRFIGQLNDKGATGYGYDFKFGKFYSEGTFRDDFLEGEIVDISLSSKSVYYGQAQSGYFTGKAYFFSNDNYMYCGTYVNGKFTGEGYRLDSRGRCVKGSWEDGYVKKATSITTKDGKVISSNLKSFSEALNLVTENFISWFDLVGGNLDQLAVNFLGAEDVDTYYSLVSFPGSVGRDMVALNFGENNFYISKFIETTDFNKAKAKYNEIARLIQQTTIRNRSITEGVKFTGTVNAPAASGATAESRFDLPSGLPGTYDKFHVWLQISKEDNGSYVVLMKAGELQD